MAKVWNEKLSNLSEKLDDLSKKAADAAGGKYDDEDYGALAAVLGIKYDPAKDGSLTEWTAAQAGKYMSDKQKELAQGKITQEKYDALEEKYSGYADLLTELGY